MVTRRDVLRTGLLAVTAALLAPKVNAKSSGYGIVGKKAPELNIDYWIDENGKPSSFQLKDHKGKWVFLKCFQSWCPGCHSHGLPSVKKISEALKDNPNVVFAGIQTVFEGFSTNTVEKVRETQLQYDLQFPMGHDSGTHEISPETMINYRTGGTPWMILINPEGVVIFNDFGINVDNVIKFLKEETKTMSKTKA